MMTFNLKEIKTGRSAVRATFSFSVLMAFCLVSSFVFSRSVLAESENPCAVVNKPCAASTSPAEPAITTPGTDFYEDFSPNIKYITPDKVDIYIIPTIPLSVDRSGSAPDWTGVVEGLGATREREKDGDDPRDAAIDD